MFRPPVLLGLLAGLGLALAEARAQHPAPSMKGQPPSRMMRPGSPMLPMPFLPMIPPMVPPIPYTGGYGSPAGYGTGQAPGAPRNYGTGQLSSSAASQNPSADQEHNARDVELFLTASGVPNEGGRLKWPSGFRILGAPADVEQRRQTEALFQIAALQARAGQVNPRLTQALTQSIADLRARLRAENERRAMVPATYEEAQRFLARLDRAPEVLARALTVPGGVARLRATVPASAAANDVWLYDNSFAPVTVVVPVGGTVQWTNHGHHEHTITADSGSWGSGKLSAGGHYSHTFAQPGRYPYHCEIHSTEMRGVVVVK